jgi:hypothetical protein
MPLEPQAAIETAVMRTILAIPGEGYHDGNCARMLNGEPPPACGPVWVSVWHDLNRRSEMDTCLNEVFGCYVTITLRSTVMPWAKRVQLRDELERRANRIRAAVHVDCLVNRIQREASALMAADGEDQKVGFRERLKFENFEGLQEVGIQWFKGDVERPTAADAGLALTVRFGGLRLIQALGTME